jgi:GxxExxY protein
MLAKALTEQIIGCAMKVYRTLGLGFLESVYKNAPALELRRLGLLVELERPI